MTYVSVVSGFCFGTGVADENYSSSDLVDDPVARCESVHRACLPPQRDGGKDYRAVSPEGAGYLSTDSLKLPTYPGCVPTSPQRGSTDTTKPRVSSGVVNRRYPGYFTRVGNLPNSSEGERSRDLPGRVSDLVNLLSAKQFRFSARGELGKKLVECEVPEAKPDLTSWPTSKEYKQVRLLPARASATKLEEYKGGSVASPVKSPQGEDDSHDEVAAPTATFSRGAPGQVDTPTATSALLAGSVEVGTTSTTCVETSEPTAGKDGGPPSKKNKKVD